MIKTVRFELKTLPGSGIWTGGSDHTTMTSIKGSSLLGGMRFWTEAFLRSFGHEVCDCVKDTEVYGQDKDVCAACHVFGCTGLARAFTLRIEPEGNGQENKMEIKKSRLKISDTEKGDYVFSQGWRGSLALSLSCRRRLSWPLSREKGEVCLPPEMLPAVFLMLEYGTLGALDQYGCGLVGMTNRKALSAAVKEVALPVDGQAKPGAGLADLKDFYFFKGKLDGAALQKKVPGTIRNISSGERMPGNFDHIVRLRRLLRDAMRFGKKDEHTALRHWVCGYMPTKRGGGVTVGSHVSLGVTEGGQLYGWGWLPEKRIVMPSVKAARGEKSSASAQVFSYSSAMRNDALDNLKKALGSVCPNLTWKEFQSARDAASPREWRAYVEAMLETPWREE